LVVLVAILGVVVVLVSSPALRAELSLFKPYLWILAVAIGVVVALVAVINAQLEAGEPFSWYDGVSSWPPVFLRVWTTFLCAGFLIRGKIRLERNAKLLADEFGLGRAYGRFPVRLRYLRRRKLWGVASISRWPSRNALMLRDRGSSGGRTAGDRAEISATRLWRQYMFLGSFLCRTLRVAPRVIVFIVFGIATLRLLGPPSQPTRGDLAGVITLISLVCSVPLIVALTYYVVDATRLCEAFVSQLGRCPINWPPQTLARVAQDRAMRPEDVRELLGVQVVALRTRAIGVLVVYPFVALVVMLSGRLPYFDALNFPRGLAIIAGAMVLHAIAAAFLLRHAAEFARGEAITAIEKRVLSAEGGAEAERHRGCQLERVLEAIRELREGAFAHLSHHPILAALLAAPGGIGLVALIDYLAAP
jgi:hypothetical protein